MNFKKLKIAGLTMAMSTMLLFGNAVSAYAYTPDNVDTTEASSTSESMSEAADSAAESAETAEETVTDSGTETENTDTSDSAAEGRVTGESENGVLTPTGNLSLVDDVSDTDAENMEFMTVNSKDGHTFYIIIDHSESTDNVYFLNQVDETDLMALMSDEEKAEFETDDTEEAEEAVTPTVTTDTDSTEDGEATEETTATEETGAQMNSNLVMATVFGIIGVQCMAGYYFLKLKPGKKGSSIEDDLDFYDDEEYENEDDIMIDTNEHMVPDEEDSDEDASNDPEEGEV